MQTESTDEERASVDEVRRVDNSSANGEGRTAPRFPRPETRNGVTVRTSGQAVLTSGAGSKSLSSNGTGMPVCLSGNRGRDCNSHFPRSARQQ